MTAYAYVPDGVEARRLGAADHIVKPLDAEDIALAVARAVERRPASEESTSPGGLRGHTAAEGVSPPSLVGFHRAIAEARNDASLAYLVRLMRAFRGNVTQAATQAG